MFKGFSTQTLDFLFENRLQNSKEWFDEHRPQYQKAVLEPFKELVTGLASAIHKIDPLLIAEPRVDRSISRIYRDTRFSKDKSLYRQEMWCVFIRDKKLYNGLPGYYFELSPTGFRYGMGYYQASTQSMESFRSLILSRDKAFNHALDTYRSQRVFVIEGEQYKKNKYADQPVEVQEWLIKKSFHFVHNSKDFKLLFSPDLVERLSSDYTLIQPIYEFLCKVEMKKE